MIIDQILELVRAGWTYDQIMSITEPPKQEPPKQEPPKQEPPKQEPPKQESPKQEPPKQEPPKQEQAKQESGQPEWYNDIMREFAELKGAARRQNIADFTQPNNESHSDDVAKIISRYI